MKIRWWEAYHFAVTTHGRSEFALKSVVIKQADVAALLKAYPTYEKVLRQAHRNYCLRVADNMLRFVDNGHKWDRVAKRLMVPSDVIDDVIDAIPELRMAIDAENKRMADRGSWAMSKSYEGEDGLVVTVAQDRDGFVRHVSFHTDRCKRSQGEPSRTHYNMTRMYVSLERASAVYDQAKQRAVEKIGDKCMSCGGINTIAPSVDSVHFLVQYTKAGKMRSRQFTTPFKAAEFAEAVDAEQYYRVETIKLRKTAEKWRTRDG